MRPGRHQLPAADGGARWRSGEGAESGVYAEQHDGDRRSVGQTRPQVRPSLLEASLRPLVCYHCRRLFSDHRLLRRIGSTRSHTLHTRNAISTSHLRRHSRFSDNDSRPCCFPVPTKTLSYDSCVTISPFITTVWTPVVLAVINII